jgi:MFS family permease
VRHCQRDGAAERFATHNQWTAIRLRLFLLEGALSQAFNAVVRQVQPVIEAGVAPAGKQDWRPAHEQARVAIETGNDQHVRCTGRGHGYVLRCWPMRARGLLDNAGLWRQPEFLKLWTGQTISLFGSQVSQLAIPLTAALVLNANPAEMGLLGAFEFAPFLLLSLFAGVWVDRMYRRPVLIVADVGRAILLGSIPAAAFLGVLRIEQLYAVGLLSGVLTVFFDVAYQSYLPVLVHREHLVEGNSKLEVSRSVAQITGPGVAGALVQLITAPMAVLVDAVSFIASVFSLLLIHAPEPVPVRHEGKSGSMWSELREGLVVVLGNPLLRSIAGCTGTSNLFSNAMQAVFVLYMTRELGLQPAVIGLIFAVSGPGALLGAVLAGWLARRLGLGTTIIASIFVGALSNLLIPLASGSAVQITAMLMIPMFIGGATSPIYNINQVSLRQAITPDQVQGRMNASMRFLVWGTIPIGALLGGALGQAFGLWPTIMAMVIGELLAPAWVLFSPVRQLRVQPAPV